MKLGLWVNVIGVLMVVSLPLSVGAAEQKKAPAAIAMSVEFGFVEVNTSSSS